DCILNNPNMETSIHTTSLTTTVALKQKKYIISPAFWEKTEAMRFGLSPAILTFVVCLSSIAAAFAIMNGVSEMAVVGFPTAIFISSIIAIAPMRVIFSLAGLTILIDVVVLI